MSEKYTIGMMQSTIDITVEYIVTYIIIIIAIYVTLLNILQ